MNSQRAMGRFGFSGLTARQVDGETIKGGNVFLESVDVPSNPTVGTTHTLSATVANAAEIINPFDGDYCLTNTAGYKYELSIYPAIETYETFSGCINTAGFTPETVTHSMETTMPAETGTYDVSFTVRLPGSGQSLTVTREMTVQSGSGGGGGGSCNGDWQCPGDQVCRSGYCVLLGGGGDSFDPDLVSTQSCWFSSDTVNPGETVKLNTWVQNKNNSQAQATARWVDSALTEIGTVTDTIPAGGSTLFSIRLSHDEALQMLGSGNVDIDVGVVSVSQG